MVDDQETIEIIQHDDLLNKEPLGSGTFGVVYKAEWRSKQVAVKFFNQKNIGDVTSFIREKQVLTHLQSIRHRNIVLMYGVGEYGPQQFMVMELAPFSMDHILHEAKRVYEYNYLHVIHWSLQLAEALDYCHNREIIHRDIKPPNMLLFNDGTHLKVCDFGTARLLETATSADTFIGTPYYLAPEIMEGKHSYKCDIFSFAVTVWEMVTRHRPTLNLNVTESHHPYHVFLRIGKGERPPEVVGLPNFVWDLISKCWSHDQDERPSAHHIVEKLTKICQLFNECPPLHRVDDRNETERSTQDRTLIYDRQIDDSPLERAHVGSVYFVNGLNSDEQPFIPISDDPESVQLHDKYCSYMLQKRKALKEIEELKQHYSQLTQDLENELRKKDKSTATLHRYESLQDQKKHLERHLSELKLSQNCT